MKVKISFEIEYDDPETEKEKQELIDHIRNYFENNCLMPQTEKFTWKEFGEINIETDIYNFE